MSSDRTFPTLALETLLAQSSGGLVCGVDEAGRGPWAGPVSAAAVILNPDDLPEGMDDSKVLTEKRRAALEPQIKARALAWGVGFASAREIEELNIIGATGLAMCRAIEAMAIPPVAALVDGQLPLQAALPESRRSSRRRLRLSIAGRVNPGQERRGIRGDDRA